MSNSVEPFKVAVPDEVLADLRTRLDRTRFPDEVPGTGWEYGSNLAYMREVVDYWRTRYDWRAHEARINRFAQYRANVDGLGIHFIHEPGRGPNPKPLLLIHGWPGSICEFMDIIPMLTDPAAHGGDAKDSFTVIAPSLPGYGFSDHPRERAMNIQAIAEIFFRLMTDVLGFKRFAVQGGDWGAAITSRMGEVHAPSLYGIHINMIAIGPAEGRSAVELTPEEKVFLGNMERFRTGETGYQWIQGTKPQTLAYGLNDSPAGVAAWIIEKFRTWSDCKGEVESRFSKDQLLTNVMVYWVTQTINSSTRLYYEARHHPWRLKPGTRIEAPTAVAVFPGELVLPPRHWAERVY
ncbi:MAG: epoxide hydrolase family protein, partial [Pseudomonadota bacterium]